MVSVSDPANAFQDVLCKTWETRQYLKEALLRETPAPHPSMHACNRSCTGAITRTTEEKESCVSIQIKPSQVNFIYTAHLKTTHVDQSALQMEWVAKNKNTWNTDITIRYTAHTHIYTTSVHWHRSKICP